jgi:arylformamidase
VNTADAWRSWSLTEREREYSPSSCVASIDSELVQYHIYSTEAEDNAPIEMINGVAYGEHRDEVFDLFPALGNGKRPLMIFLHGGYWQELGRSLSRFAGARLAFGGVALAVVEYTLAPEASLDQIVDQCTRAVRHLIDHAAELGINPLRISIAGSSAGAHLAALAAAAIDHPFERLLLFSGIYDLEPLVGTYINEKLGLSVADALRLSPMYLRPSLSNTLMVIGENETSEFARQHHMYADHLQAYGVHVEARTIPKQNHFSVISNLADFGLEGVEPPSPTA